MKFTLWVATLLLSGVAHSQSIQLIEKNTETPISDVFVYHENQNATASSNDKGFIDLSDFPTTGQIIFQHPGFQQIILQVKEALSSKKIILKPKSFEFDEVIISANKWSQNPGAVAQNITPINKKTIQFSNPATSADLLANSGDVFVQKSQLGGGSPMLRGFAANSVLLVVDGVRLNNAIYRSGNLQNIINIDPNAISQAEVIYGPGSIIYGSDALGGVMSFNTVSPIFSDEVKVNLNVLGRYATAAKENTGHMSTSVSSKNFNYFGSFSYSSFGDLKAGSNRSEKYKGYFKRNFYVSTLDGADFLVANDDPNLQLQSGFDLFSAINKFKFRTGKYSNLEIGLYVSQSSDIPRYDRLTRNIGDSDSLTYAEWYYGPQEWLLNRYSFNYFKSNKFFDQSRLTLGYQRYKESRNDRRFGSESLRTQQEKVDLYTLNIDFNKSVGKDQIYYGIDLFSNDVSSLAYRTNQLTKEKTITESRYPNEGSKYQSMAAYLNYLKEIKNWTIGIGTRYSAISLEAETNNVGLALFDGKYNLKNQALNGMISIVYKPNLKHKWSGIISSGFRAPNVDDVGKLFEVTDNIVTVPNPDLKPEYSYNQEISYQFKNEKIILNLVGYHSILKNAIVRGEYLLDGQNTAVIGGAEKELRAQINNGRARIVGSGLNARISISQAWKASSSINYSRGQTLADNKPLRHIPPVFGKISISNKREKLKTSFSLMYNFSKRAINIPDSELIDKSEIYTSGGSPGWITLNLQTEYLLSETFTFQTGIENILDQHYRSYSSGISAAGRNFYFSLRAKI
jgi:hemoglobin/transferrin/lactoferrin receptor protein